MSFEDDEVAARRARIDAALDQDEAASREQAKEEPGTFAIKISASARNSWAKLMSTTPEEFERQWEEKYQHILERLHALAETHEPLLCANGVKLH